MIKSLENSFNKCLVVVFFLGISYITIRYLYHNYEKEKNLTYDSILSLQSTLKPVSVACARPALFLLEYCHLWIKLWTYFSLHLSRYLSLSLSLSLALTISYIFGILHLWHFTKRIIISFWVYFLFICVFIAPLNSWSEQLWSVPSLEMILTKNKAFSNP